MQACDSGNGHPSVIAVLPTALSAVMSGESFLGPATCDGLLIVIEAWTYDQTNLYEIG